jgi:hypothetical protein
MKCWRINVSKNRKVGGRMMDLGSSRSIGVYAYLIN